MHICLFLLFSHPIYDVNQTQLPRLTMPPRQTLDFYDTKEELNMCLQ